jgi:hypothetical protein
MPYAERDNESTMTVIELPDEQAAALKRKATAQGLTLKAWLGKLDEEQKGRTSR